MARKRTLSTLDTSIAYEAVGLDLAKEDTAIAAFGPDHEGPYLIDRIPYDKLYELLADMAPTLVAMEPCSGAHQIAEQIQELGHEVLKTVESTLSQIRRRRARGTSGLWPSSP